MTLPLTILLICCAIFKSSAALPKLSTPELPPSLPPPISPPEASPPSWPIPPPSAAPPMPAHQPPPAAAAPPPMPAYPPPSAPTMPNPVSPSPTPVPPSSAAIKGGYWPSWLAEKGPPSVIPTQYFAHVFYSFVPQDCSTYQLSIKQADDEWMTNFTANLSTPKPHQQKPFYPLEEAILTLIPSLTWLITLIIVQKLHPIHHWDSAKI